MARRILAIDGGGIKGILPAAFLATVEEASGKRVLDHFDLIAGTSTGGIIALGIGLGLPARAIVDFYRNEGPRIFDQELPSTPSLFSRIRKAAGWARHNARRLVTSKYDAQELRSALQRALGDRLLGDSKTRLVIPAFDRNRRELHVFKTAHHERFAVDWKERAVDVALGTAAAPTFLPGHSLTSGISLVDGGVWANNPVGLAVVEAVGVLDWPREDVYVLSLGCCENAFAISQNGGIAGYLNAIEILMLGQSRGAMGTAKLLTGHLEGRRRVFRYDHVAPAGTFGLDTVNQIETLRGLGEGLAREAVPELRRLFFAGKREPFVPVYGVVRDAGTERVEAR
jgi:patatin-like phospholipase/acyl hydrolase